MIDLKIFPATTQNIDRVVVVDGTYTLPEAFIEIGSAG